MPVTNFRIRKIEAERKKKKIKGGKVDVRSNFAITSIKKDNDPILGEFLRVEFRFDVDYTPDLGKINLKGELWYYDENLDKIAKIKEKEVELDKKPGEEISTSILQESLVEAITIAKQIKLPIPIRMPKVNLKKDKARFIKAS